MSNIRKKKRKKSLGSKFIDFIKLNKFSSNSKKSKSKNEEES